MKYLEVKLDVQNEKVDTSSFVSSVISKQESLGIKKVSHTFDTKKLEELGFVYNPTTAGYSLEKEFEVLEISTLAKEISKLKNHILIHGYLVIKIHENSLYFWDTALIYEGIDTFEYCLKHHNIYKLESLHVVTKSDAISEDILKLCNYTKRYSEPSLDFITEGYYWDKRLEVKVKKSSVKNPLEYIKIC